MPTPNKPAVVIRAEGRSHRTKAELELREKGEAALATGEPRVLSIITSCLHRCKPVMMFPTDL